jgi:chromosome segregation ATPase
MDLLAKLAGKRDGLTNPAVFAQFDEFLGNIRAERRQLEAMLSSVKEANLPGVRGALADTEQRTSVLARRLDELGARLEHLATTTRTIAALEARVAALESGVTNAEARTAEVLQHSADMDLTRSALEDALVRGQDTTTRLEALTNDPDVVRQAAALRQAADDAERVIEQQGRLTSDLDLLQAKTTALAESARAADELSQRAIEAATRAAGQSAALEAQLETLGRIESLAGDTTAQLQSLNALAEHVSTKAKVLEGQHQTLERALVDSRRVNEMVWEMEAQINKLKEGSTVTARVEEDLAQLERLRRDVSTALEGAALERSQFTDTLAQHQREASDLLHDLRGHLDRLAVNRKEMNTLGERLAAAQGRLADTESRLASVSASEQIVGGLGEKIDGLEVRIGDLTTHAQALHEKQTALATIADRLDHVEQTAKDITAQFDQLTERRKDIEVLEHKLAALDSTFASTRTMIDTLREQKHEFARFVDRAKEFMKDAPSIEAAIEELSERVTDTEARAVHATALRPQIDELSDAVTALTPRLQLLEDLRGRLGELQELSAAIDRRLVAQLSRQAELEGLRVACDGLATQLTDAHQKLAVLQTSQKRLASIAEQTTQLQVEISTTRHSLEALQHDREALAAQEHRVAELKDAARSLAADVGHRLESMQALQAELSAAGALRDELHSDIAQLQKLQREADRTTQTADDQLQQLGERWKQVDERRAQLAVLEQNLASFETRCGELERLAEGLNAKVDAVVDRERIVEAVKRELETIHTIARKSQDDLAAIAGQRTEIAQGRAEVERLAKALAEADEKIADVERRGAAVEEVRRKADAVTRLLDDVRVTLDTMGEHKAMIDHVAEALARIDDTIAEARGTTKALQSERKLAQRIVESVRNIHARAGAEIRQVG